MQPGIPRGLSGEAVERVINDALDEDLGAGGDITTGSATVIEAMGAGRKAANDIHEFLSANGEA